MLDIKWIKENEREFNDLIRKRGVKVNFEELLSLVFCSDLVLEFLYSNIFMLPRQAADMEL